MAQLVVAFPHFLILVQNTIHGAPGAQIFSFVQQASLHCARWLIGKTLTVEHLAHLRFLGRQEGAG
jgi:hypothetical protein